MSRHDLCEGAELSICRSCARNKDNLPQGADTRGRGLVPLPTSNRCARWMGQPPPAIPTTTTTTRR